VVRAFGPKLHRAWVEARLEAAAVVASVDVLAEVVGMSLVEDQVEEVAA